jgi:hypothetical protein
MAKVINLDRLIEDKDKFYSKLESYQKSVIKNYEKRKNPIKFIFLGDEYECKISNFITQMIFLIPFVDLNVQPTEDFVFIDRIQEFNSKLSVEWANKIINYFYELDDEMDDDYLNKLNISIKKVLSTLSDLSGKCNIYSGTTINIHDLLQLYDENEDFKDLVNQVIKDGEFADIEKEINEQFAKQMDILREEDTCYKPYFVSKTGINEKQFKEIISSIGLKADLEGNIIPYIIQSNYLRGLESIMDFYIVGILARKALITSHKKVKDSGYLTRKLSMLLMDTLLSPDIDDCETDEYIEKEIVSKETADRYNLRYFLNEDGDLEQFNSEYHKDLIGKKLKFRSPIKCKCKDGKICHTCYGDLYRVNKNIHIGIEAVLELTEQLTQKLLSAKHLQQTFSEIIEWSEHFMKNFIVDKGSIYIDPDKKKSGSLLVFDDDSLDEIDDENKIKVNNFYIRSKNGKEVLIPLPDTLNIYLSDYSMDVIMNNPIRDKNNKIIASFKNLCLSEEPVFQFVLENNELSSSLQNIINLIEKANHPDPLEDDEKGNPIEITDIDLLNERFIELLNVSDINLSAVHAELILRELVRSKTNHIERPERFDNKDDPEEGYDILKVSESILNSKSSSISLSFEHIKKQIQKGVGLYMKNGESILDALFFE